MEQLTLFDLPSVRRSGYLCPKCYNHFLKENWNKQKFLGRNCECGWNSVESSNRIKDNGHLTFAL